MIICGICRNRNPVDERSVATMLHSGNQTTRIKSAPEKYFPKPCIFNNTLLYLCIPFVING